jgi:hypothetical protein
MTQVLRSPRRTSYPALMLFGIVYLSALAIVVAPESFRSGPAMPTNTASSSGQATKGAP